MRVLKNLFGDNSKIHADEIVVGTSLLSRLLSASVIVESGSNANGSYVKFGDGTMICKIKYGLTTEVTASGNNQSLTIYKLVRTWIFPAAFYETPTVVGSAYQADYGLCATSAIGDNSDQATVVVQSLWAFNAYALASTDVIAIGRWE